MRNFIVGLMAFILTLFPGCTPVRSMYQQITNNTNIAVPIIIDAIKERDINALESIMCNNIKENVEDLPEKIGELIDAIDGEIIKSSWDKLGFSYQESDGEGKIIIQACETIYLTTTEGTYVVAVWWETVNTFKPEETGIRSIASCDLDLLYTDDYVLAKISATEGIGEWHDETPALETETVKIKGAVYRNNFVGEGFHLLKEYNFYTAKPVYKKYHITLLGEATTPYFLLEHDWVFRGKNSSWSDNTGKNIYCRDSKWEELRAYYANEENFNYYYRATDADGPVTIPAVDPKKFDALRVFSDDNEYVNGRNIAQTRRLTEPGSVNGPFFTFYKESNDGLFFAKTFKFFFYEDELLFYRYYNGAIGFVEASVLPDDLEQYFSSILGS